MLATCFLSNSGLNALHASSNIFSRSSRLFTCARLEDTLCFRRCQMFSIGFRSRELAGQSRTLRFCHCIHSLTLFAVLHGALSCWNMTCLPDLFNSSTNGITWVVSTWVYASPFMCCGRTHSGPAWPPIKHAQTCTDILPLRKVCERYSALNRFEPIGLQTRICHDSL